MPGSSALTPLVVVPLMAQSVMPNVDWATITPMGVLALTLFVVLNRMGAALEKNAEAQLEVAKTQAELATLIREHFAK